MNFLRFSLEKQLINWVTEIKSCKLRKQCYQHVDLLDTNPTQFERVKTELR